MSNIFDRIPGIPLAFGQPGGTRTKTGLALGSAYTYASAGAALGFRFIAPVSGNLTDVWFFVTAHAGTPGVTTCELRNWNSTTAGKPGTTLHASQTVSPGTTDNKWINVHFSTPYSVVLGTSYWIVLGDAGWTTGKTITIDDISVIGRNTGTVNLGQSITAADGFATSGSFTGELPAMVLKFADGSVFGSPYTAVVASDTSNTLERGIKILGLTEDIIINGIMIGGTSSLITGLKIYKGSTAPGGTTEVTITFATGAGANGVAYFAPFKLLKNTIYRVVLTFSGNSTAPGYYQIEDYATGGTDLTNAGFGQGTMFRTIDNGSGGWTDNADLFPEMALLISDQSVQPGALVNGGFLVEA